MVNVVLLVLALLVSARQVRPHLPPTGGATSEEHTVWASQVVRIIPLFEELINATRASPAVSDPCKAHLDLYSTGILGFKPWALTMLDSSTKVPENVLSGLLIHLGNFDQCLGVTAENLGEEVFSAQYCGPSFAIASLDPESTFTLSLQIATCVPDSCTPSDIQEVVQSTITPLLASIRSSAVVSVDPDSCYTGRDKLPLDAGAYVMLSVFVLLALLVAAATAYDFYALRQGTTSKGGQTLLAFSLRQNLRGLVATRHVPGSITCLQGLRVFSLCWIMLGHRLALNTAVPLVNAIDIATHLPEPMYSLISNSYVGVDTFFFLSGFLVCHVFLGDATKGRPFNLFKFYLYRYLRLTTTLALLVGYYVTLLRYTGYGPRWRQSVNWQMEHCDKYWYLNLLYLNNYVRFDYDSWDVLHPVADCVDQGWYLTVDMQLAWLSPLILVPLWKWPRQTSRLVLPIVTLASCFIPFTSTYINKFPMTSDLRFTPQESRQFVTQMYWPTHMRATPYLVGIAVAYFMFQYRHHKISMAWWHVTAGWAFSTVTCLLVLFATSTMYDPQHPYVALESAFYAGFHRLGWALALGWIVFSCTHGYGGPVNAILSCKTLLPFSRLSYCMFITHYVLIYYDIGQVRTGVHYGNFDSVHDFFGDLWIVGVALALPLYLCCEAPTLNLLRVFFQRGHTGVVRKVVGAEEMTRGSKN